MSVSLQDWNNAMSVSLQDWNNAMSVSLQDWNTAMSVSIKDWNTGMPRCFQDWHSATWASSQEWQCRVIVLTGLSTQPVPWARTEFTMLSHANSRLPEHPVAASCNTPRPNRHTQGLNNSKFANVRMTILGTGIAQPAQWLSHGLHVRCGQDIYSLCKTSRSAVALTHWHKAKWHFATVKYTGFL
jgi:hypothetical protein